MPAAQQAPRPASQAHGRGPPAPAAHTCGSVQYSVRRLVRVTTVDSPLPLLLALVVPLPPPPPAASAAPGWIAASSLTS